MQKEKLIFLAKEIGIAIAVGYGIGYLLACPHFTYIFASQLVSTSLKTVLIKSLDFFSVAGFSIVIVALSIMMLKHLVNKVFIKDNSRMSFEFDMKNIVSNELDILAVNINHYQFLDSYNTIVLTE